MPKLSFDVAEVDLVQLLGPEDSLIRSLESQFPGMQIQNRGFGFLIDAEESDSEKAKAAILALADLVRQGVTPDSRSVIEAVALLEQKESPAKILGLGAIHTPGKTIRAKTLGQKQYLEAIDDYTITFGIGPAGTGKTYLAVAKAVAALYSKQVSRIILTRPAVEAGEKLGFLPGTLSEKIDPYLRPLFDSLQEMLEPEVTAKLMESGVIEVAPLAYMRGRTLNDAFVILDEAQNTTAEQMKMFLTRLGFNSKMVITGDASQIDLPGGKSGLIAATGILSGVEGLHVFRLTSQDVVRHELVTRIVEAYELDESK
ncbi:PhoH family protein [Candidatus Aquiluna sp. UB-MaderosW2red]|uniref:PhoH family protein n=1 Tax=Candidatus Aquiluna sp. UB-MaderosW2red TaxID=1855377 RepID=UPI000875DFD0|nr:PhoH family protein [Candidatus Aquiluna sp. UB-MaderosW2red]SCX10571.1 phosphate starvation-inducible protein PhoH [Candidatus Aquiluna sp. UB-MaderosW2red]